MLRILVTIVSLFPLLAAAPALGSIASPASGFPFGLDIGQTAYVKLKNANGCTFDQMSMSANSAIASVSPASGTNLKRAKIGITGVSVGMTNVTITTSGGTCPPTMHSYSVNVTADYSQIEKDFEKETKSAIRDYKIEAKFAVTQYKSGLKDLGIDFGDSVIDEVGLFQGVHAEATQFRQSYFQAGLGAYTRSINFGSNQLLSAQATYSQGPDELFMGGWDGFDKLQNFVCTDAVKFQATAKKETDKAAKRYMKDGAPKITVLNAVQPLVSGGSFYPDQAGAFPVPFGTTGPLTISVLPAYNLTGDNGRIAISGIGETSESGNLDVTVSHYSNSMPMSSWSLSPPISGGEWDSEFSGLTEGTYLIDVGYAGDTNRIQLGVHVGWQF